MKKSQWIPVFIYLMLIIYTAIFNWAIFTVPLNISFGFVSLKMPLLVMVSLLGLVILIVQGTWLGYYIWRNEQQLMLKDVEIESLEKDCELVSLQKDNEISSLKLSYYEMKPEDLQKNKESLAQLRSQVQRIEETLAANQQSQNSSHLTVKE